jgi:hypothetical protein
MVGLWVMLMGASGCRTSEPTFTNPEPQCVKFEDVFWAVAYVASHAFAQR